MRKIINQKKIGLRKGITNTSKDTEKILIENFVSLQKVMTNLSLKFDGLTNQISKLLELFEISAKSLAEKNPNLEGHNKQMMNKMDSLLDQNKTIARGMALLGEGAHKPGFSHPTPNKEQGTDYQESMSSRFKQLPRR
ncbi:MAG: hypothetical protein QF567_02835 [Candidatus Pacearchaeota archaeon]|jgi:hypothetical protein|nr:hypothetical protein [Candidatus Pacearchaeota archaeon]|tara:strand:+ start:778 stop:1191 length:414 start_codon:yes stop_codon:yes gene_type:complete